MCVQTWDSNNPDVEIQPGSKGWRRLRLACELAKKELSKPDVEGTWIELNSLADDQVLEGPYKCCPPLAHLTRTSGL